MINEEVLRRVGEKRTIVETIVQRNTNWIEHKMGGDVMMKRLVWKNSTARDAKQKVYRYD